MRRLLVIAVLAGGLSLSASAWGFRCGNDLILPGDRKIEVLAACGEPASREEWEEVRAGHYSRYGRYWPNYEKVRVEEWVYNLGPRYFLRIVRFENGEVVEVGTGGYGF